jgi:hypothetical protein
MVYLQISRWYTVFLCIVLRGFVGIVSNLKNAQIFIQGSWSLTDVYDMKWWHKSQVTGGMVVYNMKWWFTTWKYQFHGCCRPFVGGKRHIVPIIVPWIDGGREVSRCARSDLRSWGDWRSAGSWGPICVDVSFYWFCTHIFITHIILIIFIYTFFCIHSQYNNV